MKTCLKEQGRRLRFGNGQVELIIDRQTGCFLGIRNKVTGVSHKTETDGSWPVSLRLGDTFTPDLLRIEIVSGAMYPQTMKYRTRIADGGRVLVMRYANLVATGGTRTGVAMTVEVMLRDNADYFLIRTEIRNGSKYGVTRLTSGTGGLEAAKSRDKERLAVPAWTFGSVWDNPVAAFGERQTFGYPIFRRNCAMTCGWFDLYGPHGGIGVGYLNRQGTTMLFNVGAVGDRLGINWQLFDLRDEKADALLGLSGVYPLGAGKRFRTDPWILAPHAGDWHRMADIYRTEYERTFRGDYLTWQKTPATCKNVDVRISLFNWNSRAGGLQNRFEDILPQVKAILDHNDIRPENLMPIIVSPSENWPFHFPGYFPCCKAAGGDRAARRMCDDLRAAGVDAILFYAHAFYNHPKCRDYVAAADTGYDHENVNWPHIGNVACVDHPAWQRLWREKYIPAYEAVGAAGVYWDQGPCQYVVCTRKDHRHGHDGPKMLASHTAGLQKLMKAFHAGYKKRRPFCHVEASSDLTGRWMDIWTCESPGYLWGMADKGRQVRDMVRYTFPERLAVVSPDPAGPEGYCQALVEGFVVAAPIEDLGAAGGCAPLRQYVQLRRELRDERACGYPQGFRDTDGLRVSSPDIVARTYRDAKGITVVYYARKRTTGIITVDPSALGFAGAPRHSIRVNLRKHQAGYKIIWPGGLDKAL